MMLAMCVRKTGDTSTPTLQSHNGPSTAKRKHRPLKALKTRGKEERKVEEVERTVIVKVRDDEDGHLIYHKGDLLDARCTYIDILVLLPTTMCHA